MSKLTVEQYEKELKEFCAKTDWDGSGWNEDYEKLSNKYPLEIKIAYSYKLINSHNISRQLTA